MVRNFSITQERIDFVVNYLDGTNYGKK